MRLPAEKFCDKSSVTFGRIARPADTFLAESISCMKLDGETRVQYLKIDLKDIMLKKVEWAGSIRRGHSEGRMSSWFLPNSSRPTRCKRTLAVRAAAENSAITSRRRGRAERTTATSSVS